jgi:hypothetical protein
MTVRVENDGTIILEGACPIEDAEVLLQHLLASPGAQVDWRTCDSAHTAVIQVLMASAARLIGPPRGGMLRVLIEPALIGSGH